MQISAAALITLLPFLASAAPAPAPVAEAAPATSSAAAGPNYFAGMSLRSASPIHFGQINANGQKFWINKATASYCPSETIGCAACPAGNTTVFAGGQNTLGLGTVVPGGQQVYVAKDGELGFTQAHSANVPEGAHLTGFSFEAGNPLGYLSWGEGFVACPTKADKNVYQIYATSKTIKAPSKSCLGFEFSAPKASAAGAWQYT